MADNAQNASWPQDAGPSTYTAPQLGSYLTALKNTLRPDQYAALIKPLMYTANENFGGTVQDYQAQLVTPLDIKKTGLPQQIKFTPSKIETYSDNEGGFYNVETGGVPILDNIQGVMESMGDSGDSLVGFRSIKPVDVNGVPVFANYDISGRLTGYEGDPRTTSWINGKQRLIGKWDAEGLPDPQTSTSRGAGIKGFVNDAFVNPLKENWVSIRDQLEAAAVVAGNYVVPGSSLLSSQLVTKGAQEELNTDFGRLANIAAGAAGASAGNLSAGAQVGQAAGLAGTTASIAGNAALTTAATGDVEKGLMSAATSAGGNYVGSNVGAEYGQTAGQVAGGTAAGLLSGQDLSTALTNAAINTGANQAASGLMNAVNAPAATDTFKLPSDFSTGADYSLTGNTGGLGLKADLAPLDLANPYSFDTNFALTGGLGLNANLAPSNPSNPYSLATNAGNLGTMGGGQGLTIPNQEGATLGSIGAAAETPTQNPNLVNSVGTGVLSSFFKSLFTGSQGTGNMATTPPNNSSLTSIIGGLLGGGANLMQGETNTAARQTQANALTAAGQQAATASQFRPVGTTTRFGSSNFQIDPTTGQLTSAGYTLSPEAKAYQDRLSGLAGQGLTQAEGAQTQYAPLQQGAQSLFGLGQQYLGGTQGQPVTALGQQYLASQAGAPITQAGLGYLNQSPQAAAQKYLADQQALLAPSRDMESARLANQLQQTGRTGVSVAQGGRLGAANPEQQALANARAMQDLQLAASADQYGLQRQQAGANLYGQGVGLTQGQQVAGANLYGAGQNLTQQGQQFGAGLFGTGAQNLGSYYAGQQAALSPYTGAIAGVSGLETAGQQPFDMSAALAAQSAAAGARGGALNLNAQTAAANAMLPANLYNPYASSLAGVAGSPLVTGALGKALGNTDVGSALAKYLGGLGGGNSFTGSPGGLDTSNIDYNYLASIYAGGNPFENVLAPNETWMGE